MVLISRRYLQVQKYPLCHWHCGVENIAAIFLKVFPLLTRDVMKVLTLFFIDQTQKHIMTTRFQWHRGVKIRTKDTNISPKSKPIFEYTTACQSGVQMNKMEWNKMRVKPRDMDPLTTSPINTNKKSDPDPTATWAEDWICQLHSHLQRKVLMKTLSKSFTMDT